MKKVEIEIRGSSLCKTVFLSSPSKGILYNLDIVFNNGSIKRYYVGPNMALHAIISCGDSFGKFFNRNLKGTASRFLKTSKRVKKEKIKAKVAKTVSSIQGNLPKDSWGSK